MRFRECSRELKLLHEHSETLLGQSRQELSALRETIQKERRGALELRESTSRELSRLELEKIRLEAENETLKRLYESLQEPDTALIEARTRIVDERRKASESRTEFAKARAEWEAARGALLDRLKSFEENSAVLHDTIDEANERIANQSSKLREVESLNRQLVSRISELEIKLSASADSLKHLMKQSESDRYTLLSQTIELSEKLHHQIARALILENDCESQAAQLEASETRIKGLMETENILRGRLDLKIGEERALDDLESRIRILELEKANLVSQLSSVTKQLESTRTELVQTRSSNSKLLKQRERLKEQRTQLMDMLRNYKQKAHEVIKSS